MLFNSIAFLVFLPVVFILYWFIVNKNLKVQNFFLVVASYVFYGWWDWRFLSLIVISSSIDFIVGQFLGKEERKNKRKLLLSISILANLGFLGFFKYFNFFVESLRSSLETIGVHAELTTLHIILPVGISFYTFQTMSYTIDLYKRKIEPCHDWMAFFAFVSFFPQLVAGPIERAKHLLPQFYKIRRFDYSRAVTGSRLILWGMFKKIVIADRLAEYVNLVYNHPQDHQGITVILATIFFAFQIYCDFSGYSDIAIGVARLFGFDLMTNFRTPYFSASIKEFWSRWHISLSTWFRDYVYIPLGGNRASTPRWIYNLMMTFLVSGLWHGANWTFVIWGFIHGSINAIEALWSKYKPFNLRLPHLIRVFITFTIVCFAWIFFRANHVQDAFLLIQNAFNISFDWDSIKLIAVFNFMILLLLISLLIFVELVMQSDFIKRKVFVYQPVRYLAYSMVIMIMALLGVFQNEQDFIYFQF
ncbi:MBOAT family protein [Fulvivirgaceae bacterium BMA10]|uniref:MBOAT family protein n=1 Tax=Splendidivirga corallicola TaxID=3051826 RepID=A0ABT8KQT0_9BACT|nr:MBOAT family protein [Fulvivirgaceae bacterium BMA10]